MIIVDKVSFLRDLGLKGRDISRSLNTVDKVLSLRDMQAQPCKDDTFLIPKGFNLREIMWRTKRTVLLMCIFLSWTAVFAQFLETSELQQQRLFTSFEEAYKAPADSVFRLSLKRKLPSNFEQKIQQYPALQELHLKGMRLKRVPEVVWTLTNLSILDLSNNRLDSLSSKIGNLVHLEELILNRNYLLDLPVEIVHLSKLAYLDLWSNLIIEFPVEITALENSLKTVDMRVITISDEYREQLQSLLPKTKFLFSKSCNCKN
jgi:Leucine-rich repeat (LRR) protein